MMMQRRDQYFANLLTYLDGVAISLHELGASVHFVVSSPPSPAEQVLANGDQASSFPRLINPKTAMIIHCWSVSMFNF